MFFCTGCQNVRAIEPSPLPVPVIPPAPAGPHDPGNILLDHVEGHGLDAVVGLSVQSDDESAIEKPAVTEDDTHPPLPISRASTPESEVEADAEADAEAEGVNIISDDTRMPVNMVASSFEGVNIIGHDMRMPVNRVASTFDESIYSQQFTVHKVPCSDMTIRTYEGDDHTYVTIETDKPVTLPIATLRQVLNSIQPDPEKKRMGDTLMLLIASLFMSIVLRTRD